MWMYMTSVCDDINLSTIFPYGSDNWPASSIEGGIVSRIKSGLSISFANAELATANPSFLTIEGRRVKNLIVLRSPNLDARKVPVKLAPRQSIFTIDLSLKK